MFTVDRGHSEMKPVQETTPEQVLILTDEELFGSPRLSDADLIDISKMNDAELDESGNENADCTPYLTWEEAEQNGEHLQSEQCTEERLESYLSDADNDHIPPAMYDMTACNHVICDGTVWDKDDLTQLPDNRICIVMMDCGDGLEDLAKTEYQTLDQFQEINIMLGENAVWDSLCKLVTQDEYTNTYDFRQKLKEALMEEIPT